MAYATESEQIQIRLSKMEKELRDLKRDAMNLEILINEALSEIKKLQQ
jgi:hypothetical protein